MTTEYPPAFLADELAVMLRAVDWSQPSTLAQSGVHHGYRQIQIQPGSPFGFVYKDFEPVKTAWLSRIDPGGFVNLHRDAGPYRERWQIPIYPNGSISYDDGTGPAAVAGVPFQVEHWRWHRVDVPAAGEARIHVVLDRDVVVDPTVSGFEVFADANV